MKFTNQLRFLISFVIIVQIRSTEKRLCVDVKCTENISLGKAVKSYVPNKEGVLAFKSGTEMKIKSKSLDSDLWGVEIDGKYGYAPNMFIQESRVFHKTASLIPGVPDIPPPKHSKSKLKSSESSKQVPVAATTTAPLPSDLEGEKIVSKGQVPSTSTENISPAPTVRIVDGTKIPIDSTTEGSLPAKEDVDGIVETVDMESTTNTSTAKGETFEDDEGDDDDEADKLYEEVVDKPRAAEPKMDTNPYPSNMDSEQPAKDAVANDDPEIKPKVNEPSVESKDTVKEKPSLIPLSLFSSLNPQIERKDTLSDEKIPEAVAPSTKESPDVPGTQPMDSNINAIPISDSNPTDQQPLEPAVSNNPSVEPQYSTMKPELIEAVPSQTESPKSNEAESNNSKESEPFAKLNFVQESAKGTTEGLPDGVSNASEVTQPEASEVRSGSAVESDKKLALPEESKVQASDDTQTASSIPQTLAPPTTVSLPVPEANSGIENVLGTESPTHTVEMSTESTVNQVGSGPGETPAVLTPGIQLPGNNAEIENVVLATQAEPTVGQRSEETTIKPQPVGTLGVVVNPETQTVSQTGGVTEETTPNVPATNSESENLAATEETTPSVETSTESTVNQERSGPGETSTVSTPSIQLTGKNLEVENVVIATQTEPTVSQSPEETTSQPVETLDVVANPQTQTVNQTGSVTEEKITPNVPDLAASESTTQTTPTVEALTESILIQNGRPSGEVLIDAKPEETLGNQLPGSITADSNTQANQLEAAIPETPDVKLPKTSTETENAEATQSPNAEVHFESTVTQAQTPPNEIESPIIADSTTQATPTLPQSAENQEIPPATETPPKDSPEIKATKQKIMSKVQPMLDSIWGKLRTPKKEEPKRQPDDGTKAIVELPRMSRIEEVFSKLSQFIMGQKSIRHPSTIRITIDDLLFPNKGNINCSLNVAICEVDTSCTTCLATFGQEFQCSEGGRKGTDSALCGIEHKADTGSSSFFGGFEYLATSQADIVDGLYKKVLEFFDLLCVVMISATATLLFTFGYYCISQYRKEHQLIAKLNVVERSLLATNKEASILKHDLVETCDKLASIENNSFGSNDMVIAIKRELEISEDEKTKLEEQVASLEKELEAAAEAGLELNKIVSELLSNQSGDESIISSVEELQRQLNEQQHTILEINTVLAEKSRENSELQLMLAEQNAKFGREISSLQQDNDELEAEKCSLASKIDEMKVEFDQDITKALEGKNFEIKRLQSNIVNLETKYEEEHRKWQTSVAKVEALEECLKSVKRDPSVKISQIIDAANVQAELLTTQRERAALKEKLESTIDARKLLEEKIKANNEVVEKLKHDFQESEKDKLEAQTRLEVLSNYFKEKETQLQKELSLKEAMWLKQQGETTSTVDRLTSMQEEIQTLKSQNDSLRAEIEAQQAAHKAQIGTLENRAHETWLAARQSERRFEEARSEATALRRKLTAIVGGNALGVTKENNPDTNLPATELNNAPSPVHLDSPSSPLLGRLPPPPPFIPGPFIPPPPPHFMGIPPPFMPPGEMRPPPMGRLMSPPLPPGAPPHLHRYSPLEDDDLDDDDDDEIHENSGRGHWRDSYSPPRHSFRYSPDRYGYNSELISNYDDETDFSPPPSPRERSHRSGSRSGSYKAYSPPPQASSNQNLDRAKKPSKGQRSSGSEKSYGSWKAPNKSMV